jgi:hypothetical protein
VLSRRLDRNDIVVTGPTNSRAPRAKEFTADLAFGQGISVLVRDIDRYERTAAKVLLPDGYGAPHRAGTEQIMNGVCQTDPEPELGLVLNCSPAAA